MSHLFYFYENYEFDILKHGFDAIFDHYTNTNSLSINIAESQPLLLKIVKDGILFKIEYDDKTHNQTSSGIPYTIMKFIFDATKFNGDKPSLGFSILDVKSDKVLASIYVDKYDKYVIECKNSCVGENKKNFLNANEYFIFDSILLDLLNYVNKIFSLDDTENEIKILINKINEDKNTLNVMKSNTEARILTVKNNVKNKLDDLFGKKIWNYVIGKPKRNDALINDIKHDENVKIYELKKKLEKTTNDFNKKKFEYIEIFKKNIKKICENNKEKHNVGGALKNNYNFKEKYTKYKNKYMALKNNFSK